LQDDGRWEYGTPPERNANYAWIQHVISKLSPRGTAALVLANSTMSTNMPAEFLIRKNLIEEDLVESIIALPDQLFYSTQVPACVWIMSHDKQQGGEFLFIDARNLGHMISERIRDFSENDISEIVHVYHAWSDKGEDKYQDIAGFCKVATMEKVREMQYDVTPGVYVEPVKDKE